MYSRKELRKRAYLAEHYKKRLVNELERLNVNYKAGYISKNEYEQKLTYLLKGRSVDDWLNYYDKYKDACVNIINEEEKDIKFRAFFLILLVMAVAFPFLTNFTGYSIYEPKIIISVNKVVSPDSYLLIDGKAEPIPLNLTLKNGDYVYDIKKLEVDSDVKSLQIIEDNKIVFSKKLK